LKTAFKILPLNEAGQPLHLLAEIGYHGLSLIYYSDAPLQVEGWMNFHFDKNMPSSGMGAAIDKLVEKEELPAFSSCHIFFSFKESLIVPAEYFRQADAAGMLDCLYGAQPTDAVFSEPLEAMNAVNVYRVDDQLYNTLNSRFLSAVFYHSNTLLLPYLQRLGVELFCTIYQNSIRVILFKENKLQLVQHFDYNTPADVAYHLLNTCSQHQVSPSEVKLLLSGFIDKDSNLFEELYKYFLNISLDKLPGEVQSSAEVGQMPGHFFSHLISLAQCVS
jgi:hypothetical protein